MTSATIQGIAGSSHTSVIQYITFFDSEQDTFHVLTQDYILKDLDPLLYILTNFRKAELV